MRGKCQGVPETWAPAQEVAVPTTDRELPPLLAVRASPHCSRGVRAQLISDLRMMAQLPCTCSSQQTRHPGRGPPLCTGNVRATSLITAQHCHFKQLISRGKNVIISDESSSLFGWERVAGGWPGMQTRQEEGMGRATAWHRQGSRAGAGGQHRAAGAGGGGGMRGAWGRSGGMLRPRGTCSMAPGWPRVVGEMQPMLPKAWSTAHSAGGASRGEKRICKGSELLG